MEKQLSDHIKKARSTILLVFFTLFAITTAFCTSSDMHLANTSTNDVTVYVVTAITDDKILPTSVISPFCISDTISVKASPGVFEPASFVIHANKDIDNMTIESTDLIGNCGSISSNNVDIRVVKCWYQGSCRNDGDLSVLGRYLTPELLLKDDSLVKVTGENWTNWAVSNPAGKNYLKLTDGSYICKSSSTPQRLNPLITPITKCPVSDSITLQPVNLMNGYNKQFWVTINVPNNTNAGNYSGNINLITGDKIIHQLQINLQVFPIALSNPKVEYSLYYKSIITELGSISSEKKTATQFTAEMKDMLDHGVTNPIIYSQSTKAKLTQVLTIRDQVGLNNTNLYCAGLYFISASLLPSYKKLTAPYGVTNLYAYGPDEQNLNNTLSRNQMTGLHNVGAKVMGAQSLSQADSVADILDLAVVSGIPSVDLANKYHSYGHKIYSYANPQVVPEYPRLYRMNYGLLLWQRNYDGSMDFAYQQSFGDIWNDFDHTPMRDHVFAYPTTNGVIDTVQWEGFRAGVDDMRYLATLQNTISSAKSQGKDTSEAENWLSNLKNCDLESQDLDAVRLQMINYIISLQNQLS